MGKKTQNVSKKPKKFVYNNNNDNSTTTLTGKPAPIIPVNKVIGDVKKQMFEHKKNYISPYSQKAIKNNLGGNYGD